MGDVFPVVRRKIGDEEMLVVNARDLHGFLDVGKVFAAWIQERIKQHRLVENIDFSISTCSAGGKGSAGGRPKTEYHLSLKSAIFIVAQEKNSRPLVVQKFIESVQDVCALWDAIRNIELPEDIPHPMYVYAIKNPDTGNIKIGISKDPEARLKQLRVGNDADLRLVLVEKIEAPDRFQDERFAHLKNQYLRIRGEWFRSGARLTTQNRKTVK
ncbi:antA/AntB antirepressor family protein [Acidithiobacillus caldus]|uniref:AntA/AntB antirepressor domain-containing protein n=1 Tax=Acidithiobacillus caldus TaxID=33059 RepID=A0A1E7YQD7_9PROT|nr:antA/AntB antirepressor family protein [Acidithiobacillus caldus]MBU2729713.1 hypothetical protein [Acidithiobacillus caldus]MBU2736082.1 hypothetical protein [Acidithiobacillus caldus ATCC 51756]MBU2743859.1 hypothetical protein [Acidithiobacillus caldus]MBU2762354.1 hypothetical protein [Acidithiobacillus caldus]MBU2771851.1 hypothetical protein [Acidithiobacillus caldus]